MMFKGGEKQNHIFQFWMEHFIKYKVTSNRIKKKHQICIGKNIHKCPSSNKYREKREKKGKEQTYAGWMNEPGCNICSLRSKRENYVYLWMKWNRYQTKKLRIEPLLCQGCLLAHSVFSLRIVVVYQSSNPNFSSSFNTLISRYISKQIDTYFLESSNIYWTQIIIQRVPRLHWTVMFLP